MAAIRTEKRNERNERNETKRLADSCANDCLYLATRGLFASHRKRCGVIASLPVANKIYIDAVYEPLHKG
jgi:hypothetical protein